MSSKLEIINAAFLLLGHRSVNNLGDNSGEDVKKASALYDIYYESFLTNYQWNFAIKQFELNEVTSAPKVERFNYAYQLPPDYLYLVQIEPLAEYRVYGNLLYTNLSKDVKMYYTHRVSEGSLPAYYLEFIIEKFAELFAMPITQQPELVQLWGQSAELKLNKAIALDDQSQTSISISNNPLVQAKYRLNVGV